MITARGPDDPIDTSHLTAALDKLLPCPFCGGETTSIRENGRVWAGMKWGSPSSVSVVHFCDQPSGQPNRQIERVGRDIESAIAAWNRRAVNTVSTGGTSS